MKRFLLLVGVSFCISAVYKDKEADKKNTPFVVVLGIAQDGGYPHPGCNKECCQRYYEGKERKHFVSCLALIDPVSGQRWIFDCTPDFTAQLHILDSILPSERIAPDGIFLTHAHIGHYTGLMYLGREAMNTSGIPVYGTDDMMEFLTNNGPWSQLVKIHNIDLKPVKFDSTVVLNDRISVTAFVVPHRAEFTKAVGYKITSGEKNVIFIPDIDKWKRWDENIVDLVKDNDLLFLDGTFFDANEIPGRNMNEIPHPFIEESMEIFKDLSPSDKAKIHFIHLNHSNPALLHGSEQQKEIQKKGFHIALEWERYSI
jgi:pyrroloquinoline quinone biosynthesis protein B